MEQEPPKLKRDVKKFQDNKIGWQDVTKNELTASVRFHLIQMCLEENGIDIKKAKFLELGSGNTLLLDLARERGVDMMGVDVDPRGTNKSPQVIARIEQLPFPDESFDVVYSHFIYDPRYYVTDTKQMAKEILRILRPQGLYLAVEPHFDSGSFEGFKINGEHRPMQLYPKPIVLQKQ